jgi:hypothetical protein
MQAVGERQLCLVVLDVPRGALLTSNLGQIKSNDSSDKRSSDSEDLGAEHVD